MLTGCILLFYIYCINRSLIYDFLENELVVIEAISLCFFLTNIRKITGILSFLDLNECDNIQACPSQSMCKNRIGSFSCICNAGFLKNMDGQCVIGILLLITFIFIARNSDGLWVALRRKRKMTTRTPDSDFVCARTFLFLKCMVS